MDERNELLAFFLFFYKNLPPLSQKNHFLKNLLLIILKHVRLIIILNIFRSCRPEVILKKRVLKIYSKFIGEHLCRSVISIKLLRE